jgi:hypothetical protein
MDQGALPGTIGVVLHGGKLDEIVFGVQVRYFRCNQNPGITSASSPGVASLSSV